MESNLLDSSLYKPTAVNLSRWQSSVWFGQSRYSVINCGRRAGKSTLASLKILHYATENENSIVWYIAPTYKQAKGIMWAMLMDLIPRRIIKRKNETELSIELVNRSKIYLKGADNPDSLRGVRIDFCVFDECAFIDKWEDVWKVIRPTLADTKADCWFISTPNGFNHFKHLSEVTDDGWQYYHFTSYDNPYIEKDEIERAKREMDENSFAQEWLGEFRKMSGLIYKTFTRETHMVDVPDLTDFTHTRAIDFGFAHMTAVGYFAISTTGTEIYMYDGLYINNLTIPEIAGAIKIKDAGKMLTNPVADSAQPMLIEELAQHGIYFNPVEKGQDSVKNGIAKVAELLRIRNDTGKPTLMFNKNLTWVADEFENYRWIENKVNDTIREAPLKRDDDAMDMIRYFAMHYQKENQERKQPTRPRLYYNRPI